MVALNIGFGKARQFLPPAWCNAANEERAMQLESAFGTQTRVYHLLQGTEGRLSFLSFSGLIWYLYVYNEPVLAGCLGNNYR
jgi:hypothetical protein